jgi:hypothetical protein
MNCRQWVVDAPFVMQNALTLNDYNFQFLVSNR